jgi:AcrR family transcriptional regulator
MAGIGRDDEREPERERDRGADLEDRIVDAAVSCVARWGVAKTSLDDVAREAGCSRASVYRAFPGGKEALSRRAARREIGRLLTSVAEVLDDADTLEDLLVRGMTTAARWQRDHRALQFLLRHEPEVILPHLSFSGADWLHRLAAGFVTPYLVPHLDPEEALRAGEWVVRILLSYSLTPSPWFDATEEASVRRLVRTFLLPGLTTSPSVRVQPVVA